MCHFDSIVSSGVEVDSVAFGQFWNVLFLFSGVMLSVGAFFTIWLSDLTSVMSDAIHALIQFAFLGVTLAHLKFSEDL